MNTKESIEKLLISLKNKGYDRRQIEKELDYKQFYIDQLLSKGGNQKFLKRLEKFNIEKRNNSRVTQSTMDNILKEDEPYYTQKYIHLLEKTVQEQEKRLRELEGKNGKVSSG